MSIQWTLSDSCLPSFIRYTPEELHWFKKLPQSKTDICQKEQDITQLLVSSWLKPSLQILPSWLHLVSSAHHSCLAPIDIPNLWKPFYRIRIIMEEFGCTQIRSSSSCSCEKKTFFLICSLGLEYCAQRFNRPFDKNGQKILFTLSLTPRGMFLAKKMVIGGDL